MRYIGIFQIMEPRNLLKPDFETSVTFEPLGIFWCGFHCHAQENELYHFICVFIYIRVSLMRRFTSNPGIWLVNGYLINKQVNDDLIPPKILIQPADTFIFVIIIMVWHL